MIFMKPNFWDKNKISFFSILLLPITFIVKFLFFLKRLKTLINKETGKSKTEKKEILFLSQNFGLKKFIYNYLYIFF